MSKRPVRMIFAAGLALLAAACSFEPPGQLDTGETGDGASNFQYGAEGSISPFHQEAPQWDGLTGVRMLYPITVTGTDGEPQVLLDKDGNAVYIVAEWVSGKEADNAVVEVKTPDGNVVRYDTAGLRAFEGQRVLADLRKGLAEQASEFYQGLAEQGREALVQGLCTAITGGACGVAGGL